MVLVAIRLTLVKETFALGPKAVRADPTAPVLLGSFVLVASVLWRAKESDYRGLGTNRSNNAQLAA